MENPRTLPHFIQKTESYCGAAALSMLYTHFGMSVSQDEIWESVRSESRILVRDYCGIAEMARDAIRRGLVCTAAQVDDPLSTIRMFRKDGIEIIPNYHRILDTVEGHAALVSYVYKKTVFVNDPSLSSENGINFPVDNINDLMRSYGEFDEIHPGNVLLAFLPSASAKGFYFRNCPNPKCKNSFPVITAVKARAVTIGCPYCNHAY